jgi:hypothetical protein
VKDLGTNTYCLWALGVANLAHSGLPVNGTAGLPSTTAGRRPFVLVPPVSARPLPSTLSVRRH